MGSNVRRFKLGESVYAYSFANPKGGFCAGYVAVAAANLAPVPTGLTCREAGAIPTTGLTALQGIDDALQVMRGENVVIAGVSHPAKKRASRRSFSYRLPRFQS